MNKLETANAYIQKHKETVKHRPLFHFTPEISSRGLSQTMLEKIVCATFKPEV